MAHEASDPLLLLLQVTCYSLVVSPMASSLCWPSSTLSSLVCGLWASWGACAGRELVQQVAAQGTVIVTWANHHYLDFVLNWVHHLRQLDLHCWLVGAMDDALLQV